MSLIVCEKHGESGYTTRISESISDLILKDKRLSNDDLALVSINMYDEDDFLGTEKFLISKNELQTANLDHTYNVHSEMEYDSVFEKLPRLNGVCFECLKEYKQKFGIDLLGFN